MATRCTIKIQGLTYAKVYKHWDGYPDDMLPWLTAFNTAFAKERGDDCQYKFAQLLRSSCRDASEFDLDNSIFTGWGVVGYRADMGQEYEYILKKDGTVTYKEV
jgi:hypothetical protein